MSGFERGVGDGQERQGLVGAGAAGGVDMNSPTTKEMVETLVAMGIVQQEAELVLKNIFLFVSITNVGR